MNQKAQMKVLWPALLQSAGAVLWITTAHVDIHPCAGFDSHTSMSAFVGLYSFHNDLQFTQFVGLMHVGFITVVWDFTRGRRVTGPALGIIFIYIPRELMPTRALRRQVYQRSWA